MSVEGLYSVEFGGTSGPLTNGGIVVLESGRILGGDSGFYYIGSYEVRDDVVAAHFVATNFTPSIPSAWGDEATSFSVRATLRRVGDAMHGQIVRPGLSEGRASLTLRSKLP